MPSMIDAADRAAIVARIDRLLPDLMPKWGRMSVERMLAHLSDACRMALGDLAVQPKKIPLVGSFPFKQLAIYVIPFPKSSPTAPELLAREPERFEEERATLKALVARVAATATLAPRHPIFGTMSRGEWAALSYKHFDHHLRQFGV